MTIPFTDFLLTYLTIGFTWLVLWDVLIQKMPSNGTRLRYFLLWPITLGAFIIGFIESWNNNTK
jgi:hypothetical protein